MKTLLDEVERNRHVVISDRFAFLQKRPRQSQRLIMRQPQGACVISANFELTP